MPLNPRKMRRILNIGFVLALALTLIFSVRLAISTVYWSDPSNADQTIEPWMPLGYVGRSWDVPREVLLEALGIERQILRRRSIEQMARARDVSSDALIEQISEAIQSYRGTNND